MPLEVSDVRRQLRQAIESARQAAAARRAAVDTANQQYDQFLESVATPVLKLLLTALRGEGLLFQIFTPAGALRLVSERSGDDFVEIVLDTTDRPQVMGRASRARGRRVLTSERPLREGVSIDQITEEDVLEFLLAEIQPFIER